jgi:tetratricopeptide (TPR) repeat protein
MALRLFGKHAQRSYERAIRLYNDGAWEPAIAAFDTAIAELHDASHPYTALAQFYRAGARARLGARLLLDGRFRDALSHLDAALGEQPGYPDLHFRKAAAHLRLGELEAADTAARAALRLNGQYAHARVLLAMVEQARGEEDAAREELQRGKLLAQQRGMPLAPRLDSLPVPLRLDQVWPLLFEDARDVASTDAATLLYAEGRYQECREALSELLARMPDYADLRMKLALVHYQLGDLGPARAELSVALDLNPHFSDAWAVLGAVHLRERAVASARGAYETAAREGLRSPFVDYGLAVCSLLTGDAPGCVELMRPLVSQPDAPLGAVHLLACARALAGDAPSGLAQLVDLAEHHEDPAVRGDALALAIESRELERARDLLHRLPTSADEPLVWMARARLALGAGPRSDASTARRWLEETAAAEGGPTDVASTLELARLDLAAGEPASALRRVETLEATQQDGRGALLVRGAALRLLGRAREAVQLLAGPRPAVAEDDDLELLLELLFAARCSDDVCAATALERHVLTAHPLALRARVQRTERWLAPVLPSHRAAEAHTDAAPAGAPYGR